MTNIVMVSILPFSKDFNAAANTTGSTTIDLDNPINGFITITNASVQLPAGYSGPPFLPTRITFGTKAFSRTMKFGYAGGTSESNIDLTWNKRFTFPSRFKPPQIGATISNGGNAAINNITLMGMYEVWRFNN